MRSITFIVFLFVSSLLFGQAYEAPILHCLQVDATDDVTLTWQAPADPSNDFVEYHIWRKETFFNDDLGTIPNINTTSFIDVGASANEVELYFVEAVYDSAGIEIRVSSELMSTINPSANGFGNRVELDWNTPTNTLLDSIYSVFIVQLNYTGIWESIDTLNYSDTSYVYFSEICPTFPDVDVDIDFRIILLDTFGCTSISVQRDDVTPLFDNNPPTPPVIETVTVDTALQRALICWFPSPEGDVQGYRVLNVLEEEIALTTDPSVISAVDFTSNIVLSSQGYLVVARDTCGGNETSADDGIPHYTMNLDVEFLKCDQNSRLDWNPYVNWEGGVANYVVFGSLDGTALQVLDTIPGDQTTYLHMDVPLDVDYVYLVKALSVNGFKPSISPRTAVFTAYPEVPEFTYLANVNVLGPTSIELKALVEPGAASTRYQFEKLDQFGEQYEPIASFDQSLADNDGFLTAVDLDVRPADRIYDYRVSVIDSCGNVASVSDTSSNVRASISVNSSVRENIVSWNPYVIWDGSVLQYNIYRVENGIAGQLLATVPSNILSYSDVVDSIQDYLGDAQY
ncbi:MAG: hypothetical protein HKO93_04350, partial [Flavobacteriales bacterium]|nr:hypothetical protein [Flavobacteriales bacterium]